MVAEPPIRLIPSGYRGMPLFHSGQINGRGAPAGN